MSDAHPFPEATYHDNYSEDEEDDPNSSKKGEEDDSEDGDFVKHPQEPITTLQPPHKKRRLSLEERGPSNVQNESPRLDITINPLNSPSRAADTALEPSIINAEPIDEFIREIADWMAYQCRGKRNIEIEAKLGILIDGRLNVPSRLQLPVLTETILHPSYPGLRFESNMPLSHHHHFNALLNSLVEQTGRDSHKRARIHYSHTKVIDSFHKAPDSASKIRVTTEEKTGSVKECIVKSRVADLNIYCPKRNVDWRISVNTEIPIAKPTSEPLFFRRKDRVTYVHQAFQIDLTQVTMNNPVSGPRNGQPQGQQIHELEVEFRDPEVLMRSLALRDKGLPGGEQFDEMVRVFVNNARILVKNCL